MFFYYQHFANIIMKQDLLDLYTDYLICQNKYATATGLSDMLSHEISHDKVTRFLNGNSFTSRELWLYIKDIVRTHETETGGVLILDDTIEEKPYTDENDLVCWHHCHTKNRHIKGINILSCLVRYENITLPVGYEAVRKDVQFSDIKTKKFNRTASISKNEHFRNLVEQCHKNQVKFDHILADNWFGAKENLNYIHHDLHRFFIIGLKSNRLVALSESDKKKKVFQRVSELELKENQGLQVWLKGNSFPVMLVKKVFKNEDGTTGILYLVSNDLARDATQLYQIYQKRWEIEVYHKSIKQNASLAKSPTKRMISQANHLFASIIAFCKLEMLKFKTATNHFAIKCKLLITANQAAMKMLAELQNNTIGCVR